jgi:hypothetical protein
MIMPVIEARRLNLPSIFGVSKPFMPRSSTKPRILPPWASDLAQITATSAIGELVIQFFAPEMEVAAVDLLGAGDHGAGIGAMVGLGQAEAADPFAGGELGQVLLALLFRAIGKIGCMTSEDCTDMAER